MFRFLVFSLLTFLVARAETYGGSRLEPIGPNFNVVGPRWAKTYGRLCEKMLFGESRWVVKYHELSSHAETGIVITRNQDGKFWVTVKQATPALGPTIRYAFDEKLDLKKALEGVEIKEMNAEIPEKVAEVVYRYWTLLLGDVRPDERPVTSVVFSKQVILFAKTQEGRILAGQFPYDAHEYPKIWAVEEMAWALVDICGQPREKREKLFDLIERKARRYGTAN